MPQTPKPPRALRRANLALALIAAVASAGPASAQLLGGGLPLPATPAIGQTLGGVTDELRRGARDLGPSGLGAARDLVPSTVAQARDLLRRHRDLVEADDHGNAVVRGEVTALGVADEVLPRLTQAGFAVRSREILPGLGLEALVLAAPRGMSAREAVKRLRSLDPSGQYDFNPLYFESGATDRRPVAASAGTSVRGEGLRIGMIDGSAAATPAMPARRLVQKAFGPGGAKITPHATAVASLIAGDDGAFHGAAPGATLYVADVYGPGPTGGSAVAVARALNWLGEARTPVVNISLVGPPNTLLRAAVQALIGRGHLVVAPVGNDGPAAPPLYPAAYPGVIAVTGVDAQRRLLPEAGRGSHVDFAAPGADLAAAGPAGGFVDVRGTSYAAPIAAGLLAARLPAPDRAAAMAAVQGLGAEAVDLGARGPDPTYGHGLVGAQVAVRPSALAAQNRR